VIATWVVMDMFGVMLKKQTHLFFKRRIKSDSKRPNQGLCFTSYLSPWYFKDNTPNLGHNLTWKHGNDSGMTELFYNKDCLVDRYILLCEL